MSMKMEAQRLRGKAAAIREERAARNGETPEDGASVGPSPVSDEEDRIARSEALSAFVSEDDMRGLGTPDERASEIEELGAGLAQQVDSRMQDWVDGMEQQISAKYDEVSGAKPQSFVIGAVFGAIVFAAGVFLGGRNRIR